MMTRSHFARVLADSLRRSWEVCYNDHRKTFDVWDETTQRWKRVKKPWQVRSERLVKESP